MIYINIINNHETVMKMCVIANCKSWVLFVKIINIVFESLLLVEYIYLLLHLFSFCKMFSVSISTYPSISIMLVVAFDTKLIKAKSVEDLTFVKYFLFRFGMCCYIIKDLFEFLSDSFIYFSCFISSSVI